MDIIIGFPLTSRRYDHIIVIFDILTNKNHFNSVKETYDVVDVTWVFISEIVCLHRFPKKIIQDRDAQFTSRIWTSLQSALGTQLNLSITYHPETDGQTKRENQVMEDMLRMYVMDQQSHQENHLPLVDFSYNNSYQEYLKMSPFTTLYGRYCNVPINWDKPIERLIVGP